MDEPLYKTTITLCRIEVNIPELSFIKEIRDEGYIFKDIEDILISNVLTFIALENDLYLHNACHQTLKEMVDEGYLSSEVVNGRKDEIVESIACLFDGLSCLIRKNQKDSKKDSKLLYSIMLPDTLVIEELTACHHKDSCLTSPWWVKPMDSIFGIS